MAHEETKPKLALIRGDRSALEKEIRRLLLTFGSHEEIVAAVDKLQPRGKLILMPAPADTMGTRKYEGRVPECSSK